MTINVVTKYGLDMTGTRDNAASLALLATDIANLRKWQKPMPRLVFTEGIVSFSAWPDLAYDNLQIVAEGECRLQHTGVGEGIVFDGSKRNPAANEPGIDNFMFQGFDVYAKPVGTAISFNGIHRSNLSVRVLSYSGTTVRPAIEMSFCVATTIHPVVSSMRTNPITGLYVTAWPGKPNLQTTACTIENPIIEGCSTGLYLAGAGSCICYGGTIENNTVGVYLGVAGHNMFYGVEMEGNSQDVQATSNSKSNGFMYCGNDGKLNTNFGTLSTNWAKN